MPMKLSSMVLILGLFLSGCNDSNDPVDNSTDPNPTEPDASLTEEQLLDWVQEQTFRYFWDYAEQNSGAARERYHPDNPSLNANVVATGGTGFGLMSLLVGIERNFISRDQAVQRLTKILSFLESSDRFHGAWPHWIDGSTGKAIPFSPLDDGGDLVETAFLCQGLIDFCQLFFMK